MRSSDLLKTGKLFLTAFVLMAALAAPRASAAQGTILHAIVADANTNDYIADASVTIEPAGLKATTDFSGDTRFAGLKKGHYTVHARKLGYAPIETDVNVTGRDSVEITFTLRPVTHELATVTVEETATSTRYKEFDERMKIGKGYYITDSVLQASFASPLRDIIASRLPGIRILDAAGGRYYLNSTRGSNTIANGGLCLITVYWNGIRIGTDPSVIPQSSVGGIEFYNAGSVPAQYQWPGHDCGVLLMWERR